MPPTPVIPFDDDAEQIVVGYALSDGKSAAAAAAILDSADFYDQALGRIFDAAIQLGELGGYGRRLDVVAEALELPRRRLELLTDRCPGIDTGLWRHRIRELARRRRLMGLAAHLYNEAAALEISTLDELARLISQEAALLCAELASQADTGALR